MIVVIIMHFKVLILQRTITLIVKKVIAVLAEVARVLQSTFVIDSHLCGSIYSTNITFSYMYVASLGITVWDKLYSSVHPPDEANRMSLITIVCLQSPW